uniref:Transmembrane protein n=1 Tax=Steinernema glaseri TaxID=37863 RepID=A0A1I7Z3Q4_9BILA
MKSEKFRNSQLQLFLFSYIRFSPSRAHASFVLLRHSLSAAVFSPLFAPPAAPQKRVRPPPSLKRGPSPSVFQCPRTSACLQRPELPLEARRNPLVPSERVLRIRPSKREKNKSNSSSSVSSSNCYQICAFEVANALLSAQKAREPCPDTIVPRNPEKVSTGALVVVALVSFVLGAALMAAMWYINVKTDPQRKVCTVTTSTHRNLLLPPSYLDSTVHCPPYDASKDVRPFLGSASERQHLMR